ncbi:SGNH/GDSL hydrolase family protein [Mucilaginibacter ginsenosidivorax]|uniref:SGNH/GDSL hydrolase family protein n=1 Tax=Mucilaginibacter ginsenosidivorax TaxID=862126 RepID=A0A5B8W569_9SPHI|nr:SGNH/GDSL hydrolase family protein [Mucilaginibacter ginsenosidivorax]QEC78076.1 SGNH/GDSL hydrolase family protein [Mucilaginibacter ginsenosidivorax]
MTKILIIADSNGMPRNEITYEETWVYKLITSLPALHFIDRSRRASTVERLITEGGDVVNVKQGADLLEYYNPDVVILQLGIVDCSPRYVNNRNVFVKILNQMPNKVQSFFYRFIKKYTTRNPNYAFVRADKFKKILEQFILRAAAISTKVLAITIAPVTEEFVRKSPHIRKSIASYNNIYKELSSKFPGFFIVDPFDESVDIEFIALDEFHVNNEGHSLIYNNVKTALVELV